MSTTSKKKQRRAQRDPADHRRHGPGRKIDLEALPFKAAFTIDEFLFRNGGGSRQTFWNWQRAGIAPEVIVCGGKKLITIEAEKAWHKSRPRNDLTRSSSESA